MDEGGRSFDKRSVRKHRRQSKNQMVLGQIRTDEKPKRYLQYPNFWNYWNLAVVYYLIKERTKEGSKKIDGVEDADEAVKRWEEISPGLTIRDMNSRLEYAYIDQ